jgi:hypothetical protein
VTKILNFGPHKICRISEAESFERSGHSDPQTLRHISENRNPQVKSSYRIHNIHLRSPQAVLSDCSQRAAAASTATHIHRPHAAQPAWWERWRQIAHKDHGKPFLQIVNSKYADKTGAPVVPLLRQSHYNLGAGEGKAPCIVNRRTKWVFTFTLSQLYP